MTRTLYTTVTPLPPGVPRHVVRECLHDHFLMIDLNPLVIKREKMSKPIGKATPEEFNCIWYEITDRISYLPGVKGQVTYHGAFHDLENGLQTHIYAPMGLDIKEKWTVGGNEPGEPRVTPEMGIQAPKEGLYLREDVDLSVNMMLLSFVKKNLVNAHKQLVDRMVERAKMIDNQQYNERLRASQATSYVSSHSSPVGGPSASLVPPQPHSPGMYGPGQGYTSPTQVYDDRYGPQGQGWNEQSAGSFRRSHLYSHPPAPPYEHPYYGYQSDQKLGQHPAPAHGAQPSQQQPHEMPATNDRPPAELP